MIEEMPFFDMSEGITERTRYIRVSGILAPKDHGSMTELSVLRLLGEIYQALESEGINALLRWDTMHDEGVTRVIVKPTSDKTTIADLLNQSGEFSDDDPGFTDETG